MAEKLVFPEGATEHEKHLIRIEHLCMMHDDFMTAVFQNNIPAVELFLEIVLQRRDLRIKQVITQYDSKNLYGRSVRLDIHATDTVGRLFNIEVQRSDRGTGAKRARYYSSMLDLSAVLPGEDTEQLPETYVIFITEHDVFHAGLPLYHIERQITETGTYFGDNAHILYVNGQSEEDTPLGKLVHDFHCTRASDMYYPVFAERVRYLKEDEGGKASMCRILEDMCNEVAERNLQEGIAIGKSEGIAIGKSEGIAIGKSEGIEIGKSAGIEIGTRRVVRNMLKQGASLEQIALFTALDREEVRRLALDDRG